MKSMTGYGLAKTQTKNSNLEVNIRTVNGRFLETRFHLPRELVPFEAEFKKILEKYFQRGTVDVFLGRKQKPGELNGQIVVNKVLAKKYYEAYQAIAKELKIKSPIQVETIARLPDVIKSEEALEISPSEKKSILETLKKACEACDKERQREGASLRADLEKTLDQLESEVALITKVREEVNQGLLAKFEQKVKSRLAGLEIDASRISQEVVIQIEKADINEELSRLTEHIKNYRELLALKIPQGKKLDFYTQELLREVNTIGSKSSVSKLTHTVVQAKTLIERLREQIQNIE